MNRADVKELHFITPIENVPSILEHGLLCHNLAKKLPHRRIDDPDVQANRINKPVPGTRKTLHDFANLYFDAHNPMLSRRRDENNSICVLRFNPDVIDLPDVIVTDENAARGWARFLPVQQGLGMLDRDTLYARFWLHNDFIEQERHKGIKCAEVLVPQKVSPQHILGAYVANRVALATFQQVSDLHVELNAGIFF